MATIQLLRAKTRPTLDAALHGHITGRIRPVTARDIDEPAIVYADLWDTAKAVLEFHVEQEKCRRGPKPAPVVDLLFKGPPDYGKFGTGPDAT